MLADNDTRNCALGERVFAGAKGCYLWVTISTGIGGAYIEQGKPLYGHGFCAGEIGHVPVEDLRPRPCTCGKKGCLEAHASGPAIGRSFAELAERFPLHRALIEKREIPLDAIGCEKLAREGDVNALGVYAAAGRYLGRALACAFLLLNPGCVYIGGGVASALDLMLPSIRAYLDGHLLARNGGRRSGGRGWDTRRRCWARRTWCLPRLNKTED